MTKMNIISAAMAVASFAGVAMAGTPVKVVAEKPMPQPCEKRFSGALSVGYSTNYDYRGLVPNTSSGTNNDPIALDLKYKLNDHWDLYSNFDYKVIWDKDVDINNNEFDFELGATNKDCFTKGLQISPNYKLTHGGLMGEFIKLGRDEAHSVFQSFGVSALYDLGVVGAKGFFLGASADYVFQGATGWWFQAVAGYEAKFTERFSGILSFEYNATAGFYGEWARPMSDGDMSYGLKLQLPYKLTDSLTFTPFIGTWWLGSSANNVNEGIGENALRNFTLVAGAGVTWTF